MLVATLGLVTAISPFVWAGQLTGTHFPNLSDFPTLKSLGYDFAIVAIDPNDQAALKAQLDAAESNGLKLIVGAYPPPYQYFLGGWSITPAGMQFLNSLRARSSSVMAVYVFNEPYSTDPYTGNNTPCGKFSAGDLRSLRQTIQAYWPEAKIYHDLGAPSEWAPNSNYNSATPCVGSKYADQSNVADYVGIWYDPFRATGFERAKGLNVVAQETNFVLTSMQPAQPIALNQGFACFTCEDPPLVFPTASQILDWNCATRNLPLAGIDWYPWVKFSAYTQALADKPMFWPLTTSGACQPGTGSDVIGVSSANGRPFVAPGSLVTVYGSNLSFATMGADVPFPPTLGGVSIQLQDARGGRVNAPLTYVSSSQINFVIPTGLSPGQIAISVNNGSGTPLFGTALISNVAPAIFSADGSGSGPAAATAMRVTSGQSVPLPVFQCNVIGGCSAIPVDLSSGGSVYLTLYATGIRNHAGPVSAFLNGISVPVGFAGAQGQYDGLDQVNIGPISGFNGLVNIVITADGRTSNSVTAIFR